MLNIGEQLAGQEAVGGRNMPQEYIMLRGLVIICGTVILWIFHTSY